MYAIVKLGGRQYRAEEGAFLDVDKLPHEVGTEFTTSEVLLLGDGEQTVIGTPTVDGGSRLVHSGKSVPR
ncbi:50S ribosomal protein L21 [bacterium]|nr:50S ribosomal protein L21 [bacterium]